MRIDTSGTVTANGILKSGSTGSNGQFDLARTSDGLSVGKITMTESTQVMNYNNVLGSGIHSFSVNNTERMRIDSSGNVGIGTTGSVFKLQIDNSAASHNVLAARQLNTSYNTDILLYNAANTTSNTLVSKRTTGDLWFYQSGANNIVSYTNATERMRITSSGNVGIGTTSPVSLLHAKSTIPVVTADSSGFAGAGNGTGFGIYRSAAGRIAGYTWTITNTIQSGGSGGSDYQTDDLVFSGRAATTDSTLTEAMRITSSGTLLVGMTASSDTLANTGIELYNNGRLNATRTGNPVLYLNRKTSGGTIVTFRLDGGEEGTISIDSSSGVSYNTTSDYRLKENITEVTGAANRVKALNPVRFNFIAAPDKIVDGFLAHEVSNIVPEAIHGEKDAIDAEGNPKYQGIDQSKLVPLLTAALQEALTKIDELEARVAALETA
jgi:hypothetical protein